MTQENSAQTRVGWVNSPLSRVNFNWDFGQEIRSRSWKKRSEKVVGQEGHEKIS